MIYSHTGAVFKCDLNMLCVQVDAAKWLGRKTGSFGSLSTARAREINTKLRRLLVEGDH